VQVNSVYVYVSFSTTSKLYGSVNMASFVSQAAKSWNDFPIPLSEIHFLRSSNRLEKNYAPQGYLRSE